MVEMYTYHTFIANIYSLYLVWPFKIMNNFPIETLENNNEMYLNATILQRS